MVDQPMRRYTDPLDGSWLKRLSRQENFFALGLLAFNLFFVVNPDRTSTIPSIGGLAASVPVIGWQLLFAIVPIWQLISVWRDYPPVRRPHRDRVYAAYASGFCWFLLAWAMVARAPSNPFTYLVVLASLWTIGICWNLNLSESV